MFALVPNQITKFMGPTWGPPGSCRPQMGPMLAPWTLLSGKQCSAKALEKWGQMAHTIGKYGDIGNFSGVTYVILPFVNLKFVGTKAPTAKIIGDIPDFNMLNVPKTQPRHNPGGRYICYLMSSNELQSKTGAFFARAFYVLGYDWPGITSSGTKLTWKCCISFHFPEFLCNWLWVKLIIPNKCNYVSQFDNY